MSSFQLNRNERDLLCQAADMAGDRMAKLENDAGVASMETVVQTATLSPPQVIELNQLQREVLGKMLMNVAFDLLREDQDARAALAEALAERLFDGQEGEHR